MYNKEYVELYNFIENRINEEMDKDDNSIFMKHKMKALNSIKTAIDIQINILVGEERKSPIETLTMLFKYLKDCYTSGFFNKNDSIKQYAKVCVIVLSEIIEYVRDEKPNIDFIYT